MSSTPKKIASFKEKKIKPLNPLVTQEKPFQV